MADPISQRLVGYNSIVVLSMKYDVDTGNLTTSEYEGIGYTDPTASAKAKVAKGFWSPNAYDSTLNLQGDQIETTVKGDFKWRAFAPGFKDATINLSLRNDANSPDVQYLRQRALDGLIFGILIIDNKEASADAWIKIPVIATTANTAGDYQSSQDLTFELKPSITSDLLILYGGSWGTSQVKAGTTATLPAGTLTIGSEFTTP